MPAETKKIIVNLDVVKPAKQQTKKVRPKIVPPISPNNLKNELLNKIKYHKNKNAPIVENKTEDFSDEFCKSIDYLNSIKQKTTEKKANSPNLVSQPIRTKATAHTLKNNAHKYVQMDLPEELMETPISYKPSFVETISNNVEPMTTFSMPISHTYKIDSDVPYGCLKNGMKQGFRSWKTNQTRKNTSFSNVPSSNAIVSTKNDYIDEPINDDYATDINLQSSNPQPTMLTNNNENIELQINEVANMQENKSPEMIATKIVEEHQPPQKEFIKKTTVKKHTLGKSTKCRKVGILIKNKSTRKNVLNACKELKKTSIPDIKQYLKKHGMIKVGSTAPNDVLRQTYECSMLAGEITNKNDDILFHNFLNDKEEIK